ncbi:MAG: pilus assembly protein PilP [Deltaproteobacteria bacterium]
MRNILKGKGKLIGGFLILSIVALCPIRGLYSQEAGVDVDDDTVSEGYEVIKKARNNKNEISDEAGGEDVRDENPPAPENPNATQGDSSDAQLPGRGDSLAAQEKPPYDSAGKRDPFKPFLKLVATPVGPSPVVRPPIQRYSLDQFRISGIVWIGGNPQAMVVDPEENTYFLGVGDKIGNNEGVILEVRDTGLLVQETARFENVYGEVKVEVKESVLAFQDDEE